MSKNPKKKLTDTTDNFASEGMVYGGLVGGVFFIFCTVAGHFSYGAVFICVGVVVGLLIGMSIKKEQKISDQNKEQEIADYKKLDKKRNAFFPDLKVTPYNKNTQKPVLRTRIANGERVAGFINLATGQFDGKMLISRDEDLIFFMEKYGIASEDEISRDR